LNRPVFAISSSILYILFAPSLSRNVIHCVLKQETDSSFARSRYLQAKGEKCSDKTSFDIKDRSGAGWQKLNNEKLRRWELIPLQY
jgi:hypothetical protein